MVTLYQGIWISRTQGLKVFAKVGRVKFVYNNFYQSETAIDHSYMISITVFSGHIECNDTILRQLLETFAGMSLCPMTAVIPISP